ncbi:hypothetical protein E0L20_05825 [Enterobacter wuhouensis]|uniref:Uncharacterized protein n=1 Tax=Enterobacter wuhouensis TaxID=2529381 RepID=A0A4R0GBP6_9ENTR|nr:hypothetical protein E0L20_05825 [Enterobacter wuhouensis]
MNCSYPFPCKRAIAQDHSGEVITKKNDTNHSVRRWQDEKGKSVTGDGAKVIGLTLWCKCLV